MRDPANANDAGGGSPGIDVRFGNGYHMRLGPVSASGRREVRVHDEVGRAAGHTAVDSVAELRTLVANIRGREPLPGRRARSPLTEA